METTTNEQEKNKKANDDLVVFMRKRSDHEAPRYIARLKPYVDLKRKRHRAAAARRYSDHCCHEKKGSNTGLRKKDNEAKDKIENSEHPGSEDGRMSRRGFFNRRGGDEKVPRGRSGSRSRSGEPSDRCGRRRRKRKCGRRRRRKRSCRRKRRRRSRCGRRRRRRRRRSCSRRRRRRSCKRRRRRRRCGR